MLRKQFGGTFVGFVIGLVVGLGVALAVAVYVTKVPVPFVSKVPGHTADKDVIEDQKNKSWDPNAPLYGKNPAKPVYTSRTAVSSVPPPAAEPVTSAVKPISEAHSVPVATTKPAVQADPLGDLVKSRTESSGEPFAYFVQLGAYRTLEEAESQKAKYSLAGIDTQISERDQSGRTVYRVRVGPYDNRTDAESTKAKLDASGYETALVRVQR